MKTPVALVRCPSYDSHVLDRAVAEAAELASMPEVRGKTILLKPNILEAAVPEKAVSTRGELVAAFARLLKSRGAAKILAGESPGFSSSDQAARKSGIMAACESEGVEWVDFSRSATFECPQGRRVKRFELAAALREAELLISLPKLKTHRLMRYTGAIKNLFGLVPGLSKSAYHLRFPDTADLGSAFVDLALVAAPAFSLMDAVVAMEGEGPMSGKPKQTGLLVASTDPLALDWIAASVIGYDPAELPYLADAALRGAWISGMQDIDLRGLRLDEARPASFELISSGGPGKSFADGLPRPLYRLARNLTVARPFFDHDKCVRCGGCIKICPPKALAYAPFEGARGGKRVEIDYEKCIRCYCCHEICPEDAIRLRKRVF